MLPEFCDEWHYFRDNTALCDHIDCMPEDMLQFEPAMKANNRAVALLNCEECMEYRLAEINGGINKPQQMRILTSQMDLFR